MSRRLVAAVVAALMTCGTLGVLGGPAASAAGSGPMVDCGASLADLSASGVLDANDDSSSASVDLPFDVTIGGRTFSSAWINNNGNITFDAPLGTFTPYDLANTSAPMIAPFFADVDTRGIGSGLVTWASVYYEGLSRKAFCVTWTDVGYYDRKADHTNSFQLLLVDRSTRGDSTTTGDFDIVMNYDRIEWETGEASGGTGGLGGTSALVGYTNGLFSYYQMPGSLRPGSFLDGYDGAHPLTGLSNTSTPGRWVWPVRQAESPTNYVAMGDSFQSGEGAGGYQSGTDTTANKCHRSTRAYPHLLMDADGGHGIGASLPLDFVACSGATTHEVLGPNSANAGESAQLDALDGQTALVTIGIGGNDLDFAGIVKDCVLQVASGTWDWQKGWTHASCHESMGQRVADALESLSSGDVNRRLREIYQTIRERSPRATVVVVTYPQFYRPSNWGLCEGVHADDQVWINQKIRTADERIAALARSYGFAVAEMSDVFGDDYGLCSWQPGMNGIVLADEHNNTPSPGSYHPNSWGHELMADRVRAVIRKVVDEQPPSAAPQRAPQMAPEQASGKASAAAKAALAKSSAAAGPTARQGAALSAQAADADTEGDVATRAMPEDQVPIRNGESVTRTFEVTGSDLSVTTQRLPGSTVHLELTSPSGESVTASTPGVEHQGVAQVYERYFVPEAERGTWRITLVADDVPDSAGIDVALTVASTPIANQPPTVVASARIEGGEVVLDASGSADPEGGEVVYGWDFGDGTSEQNAGPTVRHAYAPGSYVPSVIVTDDGGDSSIQQVRVVVNQPASGALTLVPVDDQGQFVWPTETVPPTTPTPSESTPTPTMSTPTPSESTPVTAVPEPARAASSVTLTMDPAGKATTKKDKKVKAKSITPSTKVTLRAVVSPASATGTVTFADSGHTLGTASIVGGVATLTAKGLYGGRQSIKAQYGGDVALAASSSPAIGLTVKDTTKPSVGKPRIARAVGDPTVGLTASDNGGVRTIELKWRSSAPGKSRLGSWSRSVALPGTATTWTIPGAAARAKVCVQVRALNYAGKASAWKSACTRLPG